MASFQSTVTEQGIEILTRFLVTGQELILTKAVIGDGVAEGKKSQVTELGHPIVADVQMGDKSFVESVPSYLLIPVYISNKDLQTDIYIREVMLYGLDEEGAPFPFAYAWLEGADTDNILPATKQDGGESDTVHIHEIALLATDQVNAAVRIEVSGGNWVSAAQMERYALRKPQEEGKEGQYLQKTETGTTWADLQVPADFDNLLAYPDCIRTVEKEESREGSNLKRIYTEQVKTTAGILRAQRVTEVMYTIVGDGDEEYANPREMMETYTFYAKNGESVTEKFKTHTVKDENKNWKETVTKEAIV